VPQRTEDVRLSEPNKRNGRRPACPWKDRQQPRPVAWSRPLVQCRGRDIEIGSALAQREQRATNPIVVGR
jgi:hypothetical protein